MRRLRDLPINVAAAFGALSLVIGAVGLVVGISPVVVGSGSMGDSAPAGSLALVRYAPADDLGVGDVVMVDAGERSILHRITDIDPADSAGTVSLELRGDANPAPDPDRYEVGGALRLVAVVPGLGHVVGVVQHPFSWMAVAVALGAAVTVSMWPSSIGESGVVAAEPRDVVPS